MQSKLIALWSQSISDVSAVNSLVAFYDIHGRKGEVLFFDDRLAQWLWSEYSPITQKVAGSIPAQYKDLCAWTCLFVLGLGVSYV
jgi:hypothetical protein